MSTNVVTLSPEVADELASLASRLGLSLDEAAMRLIREGLGIESAKRRPIPFAAIGDSGRSDISERMEELLDEEWSGDGNRDR